MLRQLSRKNAWMLYPMPKIVQGYACRSIRQQEVGKPGEDATRQTKTDNTLVAFGRPKKETRVIGKKVRKNLLSARGWGGDALL